ncbi:Rha family transcriptional regulator [Lysinibacillus parviboronicapiens]|uniref:Rha family transcriptional regulator n=1 Tax=Lysinibacillus parviboronicapiens TaxID=436516 RepID=UPI00187D5C68|nr:Rha family transcriptional regulator [Lysinibacillus parviboronicapiens]
MNQLQVISFDGKLVTESRQVAEMIGKNHAHLLRDIKGYKEVLDQNPNLDSASFFIESNYRNENNQSYPCYLLTKQGCEMVGNKMTGEKGVLFTATYVSRFNEMEHQNQPKPLSEKEQLKASMRLSLETSEEVEVLKVEVHELKEKVDNQITLDHGEQRRLQKLIGSKVFEHASSDDHKRLLYPELHREIKDRFGVTSYKDVKRHEFLSCIRYVESWVPRVVRA